MKGSVTGIMSADEKMMQEALAEAVKAAKKGEVPIGAVAAEGGRVVARAHNVRELTHNPLGHAEILLINKLCRRLKGWRLDDVTVYVTCEPCLMCAGALSQARVARVVFGCRDPKAGAVGSLYDVSRDGRLNHQFEVTEGVLAPECSALLSGFFKKLRICGS